MSDAPGVDEVGVLPWQAVRGKRFVRKVAKRIGLNRAWATLIVVAFQATAVSAAKIDAPSRPNRKRRL